MVAFQSSSPPPGGRRHAHTRTGSDTEFQSRSRSRGRTRSRSESQSREEEDDSTDFKNYQPPLRLVVFEMTVIILLICLIVPEPLGIAAISGTGDTTIGLLRGCAGSCTSWLGAGAGVGTSASTTASSDSSSTADAASSGDTDSTLSGITSRNLLKRAADGDNTSFFLRTGLATVCSFFLLIYTFLFHLIRLWKDPPPPEGEDDCDAVAKKESRQGGLWTCCGCMTGWNFNPLKWFGYRVSRVFTATNVLLLVVICIDAGRVAGIGGVASGFYLLLIATFLMIYIALLEFLNREGRVSGWLMVGHEFKEKNKCWGKRERAQGQHRDLEQGSRSREDSRHRNASTSNSRSQSSRPDPGYPRRKKSPREEEEERDIIEDENARQAANNAKRQYR